MKDIHYWYEELKEEVARLGMEEARLQAELDSLKKAYFAAFRHARCLMAHDAYQLFVERMSEERTTPWPQGSVNEGTKSWTIVKERYGGTYSGRPWLAYNMSEDQVSNLCPSPHDGGDSDMENFWIGDGTYNAEYPIGLGNTPDEALIDLIEVLNRK